MKASDKNGVKMEIREQKPARIQKERVYLRAKYNRFREIANTYIAVNYYFILHLIILFSSTMIYCDGISVNGFNNDWEILSGFGVEHWCYIWRAKTCHVKLPFNAHIEMVFKEMTYDADGSLSRGEIETVIFLNMRQWVQEIRSFFFG